MKLIKLKLAYFQSYNCEIEIDFENDFSHRLFLITGPTGSGKTTIFDALCFVLFGKLSSDDKMDEEIKSRFASDDNLCKVELDFEVNNQSYHITRIPKQMAPGRFKAIQQKHTVYLSGFNSAKTSEIDTQIESLLGLNLDQFRQIILLPQGKFQRLLLSNSDEKEKIFRSLFNTESVLSVQMQIRDKTLSLSQELKLKQSIIDSKLNDELLVLPINKRLPHLKQLIEKQHQSIEDTVSQKQLIQNQINNYNHQVELRTKLNENEEQLNQLDYNQHAFYISQIHIYETFLPLLPLFNELNQTQTAIKQLNEDSLSLNAELLKLNEEKTVLDNKKIDFEKFTIKYNENKIKLNHFQLLLPQYEKAESLSTQLQNSEQLLSKLNFIDEKPLQIKLDELKNNLKHQNDLKQTLQNLTQQQAKCIPLKIIQQYQSNQNLYTTTLHQFERLSSQHQYEFLQLNQIKKQYYTSLAGDIASELKDNEPCPVCGSIHHPHIAVNNHFTSKQQVEEAELRFNQINQQYISIQSQLNMLDTQLSQYKNAEIEAELQTHLRLENEIQAVNTQLSQFRDLDDQLQILESKIEQVKLENLNNHKLQIEYETQISAFKKELSTFSFDLSKDKVLIKINEIEALNAHYEDFKSKLQQDLISNEVNLKNIQKLIQMNQNEMSQTTALFSQLYEDYLTKSNNVEKPDFDNETYLQYKNEVNQFNLIKTHLIQSIDEIKNQIQDISEIKIEALNIELIHLDELEKNLYLTYENNKALFNELTHLYQEYNVLNDELNEYSDLNEVLSGGVKNDYVSFERYLLSYHLEQVMILANHRLQIMSDDRYYFERRQNQKGRGKKGLELNIFDRYSGSQRSVNSLSGGETFQASLAFALGLSDYLTQRSGKNSFDFLFIDEGFGSLDSESLDVAISTLEEISNQGKTIGIISHVEELKARIPHQIIVSKSKYGSKVKINT